MHDSQCLNSSGESNLDVTSDGAAEGGEAAQDVPLDAEVDGNYMESRIL